VSILLLKPPLHVSGEYTEDAWQQIVSRVEQYVPIRRLPEKKMTFAIGAFHHHMKDPSLDYVSIQENLPKHIEMIVLAHELGHVESSILDPDRFAMVIIQSYILRILKSDPTDPALIVDEEIRANARGRKHLQQVMPELVMDYDVEMEVAMDYYRRRGLHDGPPFSWIEEWKDIFSRAYHAERFV
jgi:hypothetical protein